MADNIVGSLFGLSPIDVEQQLRNEQMQNAMNLAQLNRSQRNVYTGQMIGGNIARGLLGAFGVQDPRLQKATEYEKILQDVQSTLSEEEKANPALVYQKLGLALSQNPNFQREAMAAQTKAAELGLAYTEKQAAIDLKARQATKLANEITQEENFKAALAALPADATDDDYYNVAKRFGTSKDIISSIDKRQLAREQRDFKVQEAEKDRQGQLQRAQERNDTLIQQATLQGANAVQLEAIRQQGRIQLENLDNTNKMMIAQLKVQNDALNKGVPKDVAQSAAEIKGLELVTAKVSDWKTKLDKGEVIFSPKENAIATTSLSAGFPTKNALAQNEVKRIINEGVNELLLKAKGTQTEGDAQRARDLFVDASSKNSTEAWKAAMDALISAQNKLKVERQEYIRVRGFADKVTPSAGKEDPLGIR
jgi:hypothetical protein